MSEAKSSDAMIRIERLTKQYGDVAVVDDVSMTVTRGTITVVVGSSGSGKSTLLRMINRLVTPTEGHVWINERDTAEVPGPELRRGSAMWFRVMASFHMDDRAEHRNGTRVVSGWTRARIAARVDELLSAFQLDPERFAGRYPHELSGGEQQRVTSRALAAGSDVLLMNKPFGALDPIIRSKAQDDLIRIQKQFGTTIVLVTHDMDEAFRLGDRIAVMSRGRLLQDARPAEIVTKPADDFIAELTGVPERAFRLLSLVTAGEAAEPAGNAEHLTGPVIDARTSLRDALGVLVWSGLPALAVRHADGSALGQLTLDLIAQRGRRALIRALKLAAVPVLRVLAVLVLVIFLTTPQSFAPVFAPLTHDNAPAIYMQGDMAELAMSHLRTVLIATAASAVLAISLAILVTRRFGAEFLPLSRALVNIGQTFPPVAVLAIAVPLVGFPAKHRPSFSFLLASADFRKHCQWLAAGSNRFRKQPGAPE